MDGAEVTSLDISHHFVELDDLSPGTYALLSSGSRADTAVIFVHGFLGDAEGTWLNFQEMIDSHSHKFPQWKRCDAFFFRYRSFHDSISDSADNLLAFAELVFPAPPRALFSVSPKIGRLVPHLADFRLAYREYKTLILVGHSEGAMVIRRAICVAYKRTDGTHNLLAAKLALFAPAHLGFTPSGWIGACLAVGLIASVAMPILKFSPALVEMGDKTFLSQVRADTSTFRERSPTLSALRARVLFGAKDKVVGRGEYADDIPEAAEPDQDHVSICKPRASYDRPLDFSIADLR